MNIIGITGTLGAGKGTIVSYLVQKGFAHFSVRHFLTEEIKKRNLLLNRDTMVNVANELRAKYGPAYIVEQLYKEAQQRGQDCVIESLRTPDEVQALRAKGNFILLAVDADPKLRYQRILQRNSETDNISFEEFLANEQREMHNTDPNKQNLARCIQMADFVLENNTTIAALYKKTEEILQAIKN